jgi:hypothetical protein
MDPKGVIMKVREGFIRIYYSFDVASEILLEKLEKILGRKLTEAGLEYTKLTPKYIRYTTPPYLVKFGKKIIETADRKFEFNVSAKLYDFGVVSLHFELPFEGELADLEALSDALSENPQMEKEARKYVEKIKNDIKDALVKPLSVSPVEDYLVFFVKSFEKEITAKELLDKHRATVARILRSEGHVELSEEEITATLSESISYLTNDVVIVDWNAAFIYDPTKSYDTLDTLEYANVGLLELHCYDDILDKEIDAAYDQITKPWRISIPFASPFASTMRRLEEVTLDVTQITERVENTLKLIGDQYLARVYAAAVKEFHLEDWKSSIRKKLDIIKDFYELLYNKTQTDRMIVLEVLVVLLIIFEIIITFFPH